MNIYFTIAGLFFTGAAFARKIIAEIKSELKQCYEREALQNQRIDDCLHQIELLECKLEGQLESQKDVHQLLSKGLREGIEHARKRLFEEIERVTSQISQIDRRLGEIAKIVYQQKD